MNKTAGGRTVRTFRPRKGGKGSGGERKEKEKTRLGWFLCLDLKVGALETPAAKSTLATKGVMEPTFHWRVREKSSQGSLRREERTHVGAEMIVMQPCSYILGYTQPLS